MGQSGTGGPRAFGVARDVAGWQAVPLTARMRRLVPAGERVADRLLLRPVAHSLAGVLSRRIALAAPRR